MEREEAVYKTYLWFLTCSNCGNTMANTDDEGDEIPTNFCPNCGAKITDIVNERPIIKITKEERQWRN